MIKVLAKKYPSLAKGRYNLLLTSLVLLFIFRPYDSNSLYLGFWKFALTGVILGAIFDCKHPKKLRLLEIILAVPTVLLCWWDIWSDQNWSLISTTALSIFFTFLCTLSIIHDVLVKSKVTFETLRGVICAYFLVAIAFAYLFWFIEWLIPGNFTASSKIISVYSYAEYISEMLYFSFVTLLTIGYGDVVATQDIGKTAVVIEGIIGQFYVAILVARLVAIYSLSSQAHLIKTLNKNNKDRQ